MPPDGATHTKPRKIGPVLVVEDDAVLALAVEDALLAAGARDVTIAATTAQATETLRDGRIETVILDVHLADRGDGWAIAELVRALGTDAPNVIFATGSPGEIPNDFEELLAHVGTRGRSSLLQKLRRN